MRASVKFDGCFFPRQNGESTVRGTEYSVSTQDLHMSATPQSMPTVGVISRELHVPVHRVEYVIRSRDIRPLARAGNARVFSDADVKIIAEELQRIRGRQRGSTND